MRRRIERRMFFFLGEELEVESSDDLLLHGMEVLFFLGELLFEGADACLGGEDVVEESSFEGMKGGEFIIGEGFGGGHGWCDGW